MLLYALDGVGFVVASRTYKFLTVHKAVDVMGRDADLTRTHDYKSARADDAPDALPELPKEPV